MQLPGYVMTHTTLSVLIRYTFEFLFNGEVNTQRNNYDPYKSQNLAYGVRYTLSAVAFSKHKNYCQ